MIRQRELIAVVAALFALQMPLCALACLPDSDPAPMAAAEHGDPPCHEQAPASGVALQGSRKMLQSLICDDGEEKS